MGRTLAWTLGLALFTSLATPAPAADLLAASTGPGERASDALSLPASTPLAPELAVVIGLLSTPQGPPSDTTVARLRSLGLDAQALRQLPFAIVRGTSSQISAAIATISGAKFYPNRPLTYTSASSNQAISVDVVHHLGVPLTGKGMQIAVVDSGIDATHADLANRVTHNVKIIGPEYADLPADSPPGSIVVAVDEGPYSNTDLTYGHGTLVSGVIAADGHTSPSNVGVAPDAELIGYGVGDGVQIISVIAAFDHILDHSKGGTKEDWGIDVVNNSWGDRVWKPFDPDDPVIAATKALTDRGIAVVFPSGNIGDEEAEMTMNSRGVPPWIISAAGSTLTGDRWTSSSNGLIFDNALALPHVDGHVRFTGDRLGIYHPTIAAPGAAIESTCAPTGFTIQATSLQPCNQDGTLVASGTSFSAPHVTGVVALLRQARPGLTVPQIRQVLEATAKPVSGVPFWQFGYGIIDAAAAVEMLQSENFDCELAYAHGSASATALSEREYKVRSSDHWAWDSPLASVAGVPDTRVFPLTVPSGAAALKIALAYPSAAGSTGKNGMMYTATVKDALGTVVAVTRNSTLVGVSTVLVDLTEGSFAFGEWTVQVVGTLGFIQDPRYDFKVTLIASILDAQDGATDPFEPVRLHLAFEPDPLRSIGQTSPEGCLIEPGEAHGKLATQPGDGQCHSALFGYPHSDPDLNIPSTFTSDPFVEDTQIGGEVAIVVHFADSLRELVTSVQRSRVDYRVIEVTAAGTEIEVSAGETLHGHVDGRNAGSFQLPTHLVAAGSRLRIELINLFVATSSARMLFGGEAYGDAGIRVPTGIVEVPVVDAESGKVVKRCKCNGAKAKGACK
jgi:serine protease AprX